MRLLHVLSQLPDRTGSGIYLRSLAREAAARGHQQRVVAAANMRQEVSLPGIADKQLMLVRFGGPSLPFKVPGMSDIMPYPSTRFSDLTEEQVRSYLAAFEEALQWARHAGDPQVVHVNHLWLVAALCRRVFPDLPVVASCHGSDLRQLVRCPSLAKDVIPHCNKLDHVFALTPHQANQIQEILGIPPRRITVTGAGINTNVFGPSQATPSGEFQQVARRHELPIPCEGIRLAYVGKLSRAKGVSSLLDAVEILRSQEQTFSLLLIGDGSGDEAEEIKRRARALSPPVYMLGHCDQSVVADILRGCHIFVLPSFSEGLPLTMLEALVSGCRAVLSDLPSLRDWPEPGLLEEGVLERVALPNLVAVDQPDPADLGGYAERLASTLTRQLQLCRHKPPFVDVPRLVSEWSWGSVFGRVEKIYTQVAGQGVQ